MTVTTVRLGGRPDQPLLVVGPSLGTSAMTLWGEAARLLAADFQVVGWDLPGHGYNRAAVEGPTTMPALAQDLLEALDRLTDGFEPVRFHYAGDSVGGAVGLQLLLDAPQRVLSATLCCSAAHFGGREPWQERIATVTAGGTSALVEGSKARWFGAGFVDREPERAAALLQALSDADDAGYRAVCAALADFDVRDRLSRIDAPVLTIAGTDDVATPPETLALVADRVQDGRAVVLPGVGHLAPVEAPAEVARLIREHVLGPAHEELTLGELHAAGTELRRAVLTGADLPEAAAGTRLIAEFDEFVTTHAWGGVWARPGLDTRSRLLVGLGALVALRQEDELAVQLRAARRHGVDQEEILDALLQCAVHCGVPAASAAVRIAQRVFTDDPE